MSSLFPPKVTVNLGIGSTIYLSNSILAGERNRKYVCIYGVFCQINILSLEMQIISKLLFSDFLFTWPHFFFLSKFNQIQMFLSGNCMIILFPRQLFSKLHLPGCLLGQQFRWFTASLCEILSGTDCDTLVESFDGADDSCYYLIEAKVHLTGTSCTWYSDTPICCYWFLVDSHKRVFGGWRESIPIFPANELCCSRVVSSLCSNST